MARLRYVKGPDTLAARPAVTRHTVRSLRALYETEPAIAAALLPRPLSPAASGRVLVQFADVTMQLATGATKRVGAATVGVACSHEGLDGYYVLAMPMEGEFVVIGGRERFGEPKKLAETQLELDDERVRARVTRHGITFLELGGRLGPGAEGPRQLTERFFTYKAMPACRPDPQNHGFDGEVLLVMLTWERDYSEVRRVEEGSVILRESPYDPLVDVPVKRLVSMELALGVSRTSGEVLRAVPGEWLAPFLVQRYDEPQAGIEVPLPCDGASGA